MEEQVFDLPDLKMQRLKRMSELINSKSTGNPEQFARRLKVGRARLLQLIKMIREIGIELNYDQMRETYYFEGEKKYVFQCRFVLKEKKNRLSS